MLRLGTSTPNRGTVGPPRWVRVYYTVMCDMTLEINDTYTDMKMKFRPPSVQGQGVVPGMIVAL